jgi:hypothetical protein
MALLVGGVEQIDCFFMRLFSAVAQMDVVLTG